MALALVIHFLSGHGLSACATFSNVAENDSVQASDKSDHSLVVRRCRNGLAIVVLVIFVFLVVLNERTNDLSDRMLAGNNCRQILISLKTYSADHDGMYPEGTTANDAFRKLIKGGLLDDELPFSCPSSPYHPDNNIGDAPDYVEALRPGENHWAMTRGLTERAPGDTPLVFENPLHASWPPYWDATFSWTSKSGRAWPSGSIIVGRNDGSVGSQKLEVGREHRERVTLTPTKNGKNLFDLAGPHEVMDVAK